MTNYAEKIDWQTLGVVADLIEKLQTEARINPKSSDVQKDFMLCVQGMQMVADNFLESEPKIRRHAQHN
jgi:hypothetical protein